MLSSLSSIVRTLRYIKSPCIFLFPGGGFQLLMVRTRRHCNGCNDIFIKSTCCFTTHSTACYIANHFDGCYKGCDEMSHLPVVAEWLQRSQWSVLTSREDVFWRAEARRLLFKGSPTPNIVTVCRGVYDGETLYLIIAGGEPQAKP